MTPLSYTPVLCLQVLIFVGIFYLRQALKSRGPQGKKLHISEVILGHFVAIFLKAPTLEEFKLPFAVCTSALLTQE